MPRMWRTFGTASRSSLSPAEFSRSEWQGGFTFGDNPKGLFIRNNYTYSDDIVWEKGKHDLHYRGDD